MHHSRLRGVRAGIALGAMLAFVAGSPLLAQESLSREQVTPLLALLSDQDATDLPEPGASCVGLTGTQAELCRAFVDVVVAARADDRDAAHRAEQRFARRVTADPHDGLAWYGLGLSRLQRARLLLPALEGPAQPLGVSSVAGAGHAMVRALESDSSLSDLVLPALAVMPIPREGASQLRGRLTMLRAWKARLTGPELVGAAEVERRFGHRAAAVELLHRAAAVHDTPRGVVALELARELHAVGRSRDGAEQYFSGADDTTTLSRERYRAHLAWTATTGELEEWDGLPPGSRPDWLRAYWGRRDVAGGWPAGERLAEHYRRFEHAWEHFAVTLPVVGRSRMSTRTASDETRADQRIVERVLRGEPSGDDDFDGYVAMLHAAGLGGPLRAYRTEQTLFDDRGVIWIRHGKPDRAARSTGGEALEVWAYDRIVPKLVLQFREEDFDGQVGATVLVPTLLDVPGRFRDQFCTLVRSLCAANTLDPRSIYEETTSLSEQYWRRRKKDMNNLVAIAGDAGRGTPGVIAQAVQEGVSQIARATSTDRHERTFTAAITPSVQFYGLRRGSGTAMIIAVFALPGEQLVSVPAPDASDRAIYPVRFVLSATGADGVITSIDTVRYFAAPQVLHAGQFLTGLLEIPLPPGRYLSSLAITQEDGRGAVADLDGIPVPGDADLQLSSIVLGAKGQGVAWSSDRSRVPLNPLNVFRTDDVVELFYQVSGLDDGEGYQATFLLTESDSPERVALELRFNEEARGSELQEVHREIRLRDLEPGRYQFRVMLRRGESTATELGWLVIRP